MKYRVGDTVLDKRTNLNVSIISITPDEFTPDKMIYVVDNNYLNGVRFLNELECLHSWNLKRSFLEDYENCSKCNLDRRLNNENNIAINPSIPVNTPKGSAEAWFLIDYGPEFDIMLVTVLDSNGEIWTYKTSELRGLKNISLGRTLENKNEK